MIIAVDGPAAAGKGTLAKGLAQHFGYHYLDTGSLYRRVALGLLEDGLTAENIPQAIALAGTIGDRPYQPEALRTAQVAAEASKIASIPELRQALMAFQRDFARKSPGAVLDGRDIGTVICPEAETKLFVTASAEVRASRRLRELAEQGEKTSYEEMLAAIKERDLRDSSRAVAPLKPAPDAVLIDTSGLTIAQALALGIAAVTNR